MRKAAVHAPVGLEKIVGVGRAQTGAPNLFFAAS